MISPTFVILTIILLAAAIFLMLPDSLYETPIQKAINLPLRPTKEIDSIIMFVTPGQNIKTSIAFNVMTEMKSDRSPKKVWLIHGPIKLEEKEDSDDMVKGSSYENAVKLKQLFQSGNFHVEIKGINGDFKANDPVTQEIFETVNSIFASAGSDVVCDFTAGPKPISLGMALASVGEKGLIYFPNNDQDTSHYLHVKIEDLLDKK